MTLHSTRVTPGSALQADSGQPVHVLTGLGEGSFARVYRGEWGQNAVPCALKVAKPEVDGALDRLESERQVLAALRHTRVVALLDAGRSASGPYLVLEWLDGQTLLDLVHARRRLPLRQALDLLGDACDGLVHVHERGLAHGDLRPQNVIVVPGRGAVLTDPGEPLPPAPAPSAAEDVRALGRLFHLMLAGQEPRPGAPVLTPAAGYNRAAATLWEATQQSLPPTARELKAQVVALRSRL